MTQTGTDLVGAGYPVANAIQALLGGTSNSAEPNLPVASNLYFGLGNLQDVGGPSSAAASVYTVAVPVTPGMVISKISWVAGATAPLVFQSVWSALYSGAGSAPALLSTTASPSSYTNSTVLTFTLTTPQTITANQAPYGYVYASYCVNVGSGSPNGVGVSLISTTAGSATLYPWFATSPIALGFASNGGTGSVVPTTLGAATRVANPPVVLLS